MITVSQLAAELGVSSQTIRRFCKTELQLVAPAERVPLQLDATQAAIVADHFSGRRPAKSQQAAPNSVATVATDDATNSNMVSQEVAELMQRVARLEAERDAADQRAAQYRAEIDRLIEEHDKERADNAAARAQLAGALESAEQKAARAEAEAGSYRPSLFGFYRKEKAPLLDS